jgi:antitoxin (DNA-binding transcriptional repressor) of toxin-antitoxin stability system
MTHLTVRDFRSQMARSFDRVDAGEHVFIRRKNQLYTIVPVSEDDLTITPELAAKIEKARQEYREGKTISLKTHEDIDRYFESM